MLERVWRKGNPFVWLAGRQIGAVTVESGMEIPQKIKNGTSFWPKDYTSGHSSEETQNTNSKEHKHPYVHCNIIYNHQDMETAQVSISRRVNETTVGHLYNGILLSHRKEENFILCDSMDGPGENNAKWNNLVREREIPYEFMLRDSNEQTELKSKIERDSQIESRLTARGGGG